MYLWMIIATFLAALAVMGTSLRPDIKRLYIEPQAQNVVTKLYVQHRAAMKYVSMNKTAGVNQTPFYQPGEISAQTLAGYVPYGFQQEHGTASFRSVILCLDANSTGHSRRPSSCEAVAPGAPAAVSNCCAAEGQITYLVTYGVVPYKWSDIHTGKPNDNLRNAMKDTLGYANGFGYVVSKARDNPDLGMDNKYDNLGTDWGLTGQGSRPYYSLPEYLIHDDDFADKCTKDDYCLIYMSTF